MSSRERVLAAINHQEPDRVPIDLGGESNTGIAAGTYTRLRERLGIEGEPVKVFDVEQMLAWVEQPVVGALGVDVLPIRRLTQAYGMRLDNWRPWRLDDGTPVQMPARFDPVTEEDGSLGLYLNGELVAKKVSMSPYFDPMIEFKFYNPLPPVETFDMWAFTDEELGWARRWAERLRAETDKALLGDPGVVLTRWSSYQEWLYTLAADPDYVLAFYDRKVENMLTNLELYAQAVGNNIDIFRTGEDYGTQKGMMISPKMFNEMIAPYYKRVFDWIHQNTSWKIFFHCCGAIYPIIGTLIECGIDILNPVQTTAVGMDPAKLKAEFGEAITFWGGGIDTQSVLPFGSPEEVRAQVRERIQIFGLGGGFVFTPVHNIQEKIPVDNLLAMYEAVHEYGQYPIRKA
ncbi:MAG: methyltransferase [Chloroflexi bacterium]|nr:methyltransferase [Chloroflexota bacterium]